jgi:hypothetical protein
MIEGTSSPSYQSSPNSTHNPNPMSDETLGCHQDLLHPTCSNF